MLKLPKGIEVVPNYKKAATIGQKIYLIPIERTVEEAHSIYFLRLFPVFPNKLEEARIALFVFLKQLLYIVCMKHTLYPIIFIGLLWSCISESPRSRRAEKQATLEKSNLVFRLDYDALDYQEEQPLLDFIALFEHKKSIRLANIQIQKGEEVFYSFRQNLGDIVIEKERADRYSILEHYILPIGSVYGKTALVRYYFDPYKGTLKRDTDFQPQLSIYDYWSNHVVKEYDSYLNDTNYTTSNIEQVPHQAYVSLRYLMFNLTLAAILEDCQPCRERMQRIANDYKFVEKEAYYQQNLSVCQAILARFKNK